MQKKCKCGQELLVITDSEIIGRDGGIWYVCPMILYGCEEEEHTSIIGKLNAKKNTMPDLPEIC